MDRREVDTCHFWFAVPTTFAALHYAITLIKQQSV